MPDGRRPASVVYDTNVLISALAFHGSTRQLWHLVEADRIHLLVSEFILGEFTRKLKDKLRVPSGTIDELVNEILTHAEFVKTTSHLHLVAGDDTDNRILECAVDGKAQHLVSGDRRHLLPLKSVGRLKIVSPSVFLRKIQRVRIR